MKTLKELEGTRVALLSPIFHATIMEQVTLHTVEDGGIWIESQKLIDQVLSAANASMAPKTLVFFLPWHKVTWIMSAIDVPSISNRAAE
jgi:hypothetical protein